MGWIFRYIPFANLYDLSLAFAFGAGMTTLLIAHRKNFRFLGAITKKARAPNPGLHSFSTFDRLRGDQRKSQIPAIRLGERI